MKASIIIYRMIDTTPPPLTRAAAGSDPFALFSTWFQEADDGRPLPNAMNIATVDAQGRPRARMVLFKELHDEEFVFYTNYNSAKSRELQASGFAALTFWWEPPGRQVRVEGSVRQLSAEKNEQYFRTRPRSSQLGAYASHQSQVVGDHNQLQRQFEEATQRFEGQDVPCPEFWGGYALSPHTIEFWQNASCRLHDRIRFRLGDDGMWQQDRLSP